MAKEDIAPLFQLIHGMSKMEKRHFKLYSRYNSRNEGEVNYLTLFDIIEKQSEYDEEKIIKKNIVKAEHLRMLKGYLYNLILESMRVLRQKGNDIDMQLRNITENEMIMREIGNEKEEYKFLYKAKELALQHERWGVYLDILLRESAKRTRERNQPEQEKVEKEIAGVVEKIKALVGYKKEHRELAQLLKKADRREIKQGKILPTTMKKSMAQNISKENSALAIKEHFLARMTWQAASGDFKGALKTNQEALAFVEANYDKMDFAEVHYASLLNNITCMQFEAGDIEGALATIEKHRTFVPKTLPVKDRVFLFTYTNESNIYMLTGEFEKGIAATRENEPRLLQIRNYPYPRVLHSLYFNIASMYFGAGRFEQALQWTRKTTNAVRGTAPEDIQSWAHILTVIIHYEKKTPDIIEHLTSSTYRYLTKRERLYKVEDSILDFFRRLVKLEDSKKAVHAELLKFRDELTQITKDPTEQNALYYFDILAWIKSKTKNKTFAEVVREKAEAIQ